MSAKHTDDLVMCRKITGINVGKVCAGCEGRCCICDSYVRSYRPVRICDSCAYGTKKDACIICGNSNGISDAYYCKQCVMMEKDKDGCPVIINLGSSRLDKIF
ncbi:phd finger-like domain-containing protein 5a [Anaeramoeba flamelloides]|uniref:Phd finger-like domain-containing protein 5a n=1 Tax=Anaeramoeba flamelloides TaxID=1746091 RepID=A0AAV7Z9E7_9EUKA|nr:phd finger-like domain-containing protein 5a [Anaeramoeba flamelloides]